MCVSLHEHSEIDLGAWSKLLIGIHTGPILKGGSWVNGWDRPPAGPLGYAAWSRGWLIEFGLNVIFLSRFWPPLHPWIPLMERFLFHLFIFYLIYFNYKNFCLLGNNVHYLKKRLFLGDLLYSEVFILLKEINKSRLLHGVTPRPGHRKGLEILKVQISEVPLFFLSFDRGRGLNN